VYRNCIVILSIFVQKHTEYYLNVYSHIIFCDARLLSPVFITTLNNILLYC